MPTPGSSSTGSRPASGPARASYVPLRVHGHHSLLTGVDAPATLCARAARLGLEQMALTDVDTLAGVVDFLKAAERHGVRPIVGAELSDPSGAPGRLVALVESERGWQNLCKLVSARNLGDDPGSAGARLDGPERFTLASSAARFREGLVFLADHPRLLVELAGRVDARNLFAALPGPARSNPARSNPARSCTSRAAAGDEPVGALDPSKVPPPARPAPIADLLAAARAVGVATLAVPDVYWAEPAGAVDHRVRVAIKHNALCQDLPEAWLARAPAHLPSSDECRAHYGDVPEVRGPFAQNARGARARRRAQGCLERTLEVAERCRFRPALGGVQFPTIALEEGQTPWSRLYQLAIEGATRRFRPLRPEVVRRLDYELGTIERLGFAPYFLLVKQIADFARARGIPCVGRGSAADSLVSYCLELTDADPLRYRLPFERFLNPARRDRPDIDLDFCWRRRDEVLEHVYQAFGGERTAMISTLATFGLRSAFREAALVEGLPPAVVNRWSRRLPWIESNAPAHAEHARRSGERDNPVARALRRAPECRAFPFEDERWQRVLDAAQRLLGTPRHFGLHPGGVVVSPGAITDVVSCRRAAKGVVVTELDKDAVEAIGLVKMDLLGNRALTTIDDALGELARRGIRPDLAALREDDPDTARLLIEGRTLGCFQIESPGMRNLLQQTRTADMDAVIQAVALIRPGPASSGMKDAYVRRLRGLEEPRAPHPRLTELLWDTQGVMLYQEDVMQVAARMAGMDLPEADLLRRTLQKRHGAGLEPLRARFLAGAAAEGVERADAERVWELISNFASFAFCKAHAVTYGRIAYRAAYLKAHFPAVFLVAFLQSETGYYDARVYVEEARRLGVPVLGPDVNKSGASFAVEWLAGAPGKPEVPALRVGLGQVKGLGQATLERLLAERARGGPYLSLPDLAERTRGHTDELEALIQCGALAAFDRTRPELLWRLHLLRAPARRAPRGSHGEGAPLDPGQLDACRATPASRAAQGLTGGWSRRGLGLGALALEPGETASLFGAPEPPGLVLPGLPDLDARAKGLLEIELLGFPLHQHPVRLFPCAADARLVEGFGSLREAQRARRGELRPTNPVECAALARFPRGRVTLRGWLAASRRVRTQNGEWMRFLTLEDESGLAEVVLFPDVYASDGARLVDCGPHCITGVVDAHLGAATLRAERIW